MWWGEEWVWQEQEEEEELEEEEEEGRWCEFRSGM
jgi:hypothetical protein